MTEYESVLASLDTLSDDQAELFDELESGFATRVDVVLWLHKVSARTLGMADDQLALDVLRNRYRLAAMLEDPRARARLSSNAPDDDRARRERKMLANDELLEACRDAMQFLGRHADEHVGGYAGEDLGPQRYLAMRPALHDTVSRQRGAIKRVLGRDDSYPRGLESGRDVERWVRGVIRSVKGSDAGISQAATWDLSWRTTLTADPTSPTLHLHLADRVLPIMNRTIRESATGSREQVEKESGDHGPMEV